MNNIEKALIHGLFIHLHHNIDKVNESIFMYQNKKIARIPNNLPADFKK
jgi:hypothetical protein